MSRYLLLLLIALDAGAAGHHCVEGYTRSRAPVREFARLVPCPVISPATGRCLAIVDHIVALCRGGADTPINMAWQTREQARAKDKWELSEAAPLMLRNCMEHGGCFIHRLRDSPEGPTELPAGLNRVIQGKTE